MKKQIWVISVLSSLLLVLSVVLTGYTVGALNSYKQEKEAIAEELNFKERLLSTSEWFSSGDVAKEKLEVYAQLQGTADDFYQTSVNYSLIILTSVIVYLLTVFVYYRKTTLFHKMFGIGLIISSLCLIYLALQAPFIEVEAFSTDLEFKIPIDLGFFEHTFEKQFDGKISYLYQNKSVFQLIYLLFSGGNIIVGIALVLFSVVFPLFKLISSLIVLLFPNSKYAGIFEYIILRIGKWSMADVFVAAIFLVCFSITNMNVGVETSANTLIGLYYFLGFVMLSILSGYFVKKTKESGGRVQQKNNSIEFIG